MEIERLQSYLIKMIKEENQKIKEEQSTYFNSIWFQPETGIFLFCDRFVFYDVIQPLIENKIIVFKGIENHQGEKMLRYILKK